jgi:hypothetical protein
MRHAVAGFLILASCAVGVGQDDKALKSGPQSGTVLPAPFDALNVSGKIAAGRQHCLVCQNGLSPAVLVFAREPAMGKDAALDALMKKLNTLAGKHEKLSLGAFVVFLSPDARSSVTTQSKDDDIEKLLEEAKARNALLMRLKQRAEGLEHLVVACYPSEGPKGYDVNPKADVTVIFYHRLRVVANWAYPEGVMTDADVDAMLKRVEESLAPEKKGKGKAPLAA